MTDNPYQAPSTDEQKDDVSALRLAKRPLGIAILSVLHILGGLFFLSLFVLLAAQYDQTAEFAASKGIPMVFFLGMMLISCALPIVTAVGLWRGRNWAWWIAACLGMQMIFNQLARVIKALATELPAEALIIGGAFAAATVLVPVLAYAYYFKRNVRSYFGVRVGAIAAIGLQVAINVAILIAFAICFIAVRVTSESATFTR